MQSKPKRKSSLENSLTLLTLFTMDEPELGVTSISKKLGVSKSTAHRLLTSLVQEGFVYKDSKTNLYSLGATILSLVNIVNSQIHISNEVIPLLNILVEKTKHSAHLAILENENVVYIQTMKGVYPCLDSIQLGTKRPAHLTAAGQVILANNREELNLAEITNSDLFHEKLNMIREKGNAISKGEFKQGVTELAVPVYKNRTDVIASISITSNNDRIISSRIFKQYTKLLHHAANELQKMIQMRG